MKNKLRTLPVTLQNLLIYRVALAILALGASLALAIFLHDVHFALPGLILCVTMLVSATLLYRLLMQGRYLRCAEPFCMWSRPLCESIQRSLFWKLRARHCASN